MGNEFDDKYMQDLLASSGTSLSTDYIDNMLQSHDDDNRPRIMCDSAPSPRTMFEFMHIKNSDDE